MSETIGGGNVFYYKPKDAKVGDVVEGVFESVAFDQPNPFDATKPQSWIRLRGSDGVVTQFPLRAGTIKAVRENVYRFVADKTILHFKYLGEKTSKGGKTFKAWDITADNATPKGQAEHPNVSAAREALDTPF